MRRTASYLHWATACVLTVVYSGCDQPASQEREPAAPPFAEVPVAEVPVDEDSRETVSAPEANDESASAEVTVAVGDVEAYNELLAKHHGKVVLVDFWATWCPPCLAQFPHTVKLSEKHGAAGLAVVSVSGDQPREAEKVLEFLKRSDATFDNLISQYGVSPETAEKFEIVGGALPFYKLYDRAGELRHQFGGIPEDGVEEFENIDRRVEELLAEE